jgi:cytochrome P450
LFCNDLLRAQKAEGFNEDQAAYISGSLLEAGSDTTASTLYGFILACIIWPDVQKEVQEEVDRVVGPDRLPTIEDYENLPYVRACIKESIRWMPTVILGVPHAALEEDTYKGWRIPAGATIINNVWAIHMDPNRSPSPRVFNPDRFASDPRSLYESATGEAAKRDNYVFGAGRRLCQGIHIAERSLALGISRLVWAFDFSPALDEKTGRPVVYDRDDLVGGITVQPRDYKCTIESRGDNKARIIRDAVRRDASEFLHPVTGQWSKTPENMAFSTYIPEDIKA